MDHRPPSLTPSRWTSRGARPGWIELTLALALLAVALPAAAQPPTPGVGSEAGFEAAEFRVNVEDARIRTPDAGFDRAGRFVVVWEDQIAGLTGRVFDRDRTPLGDDTLLVANDSTRPLPFHGIVRSAKDPDVVVGADRDFFLLWTENEEDVSIDIFFESRDVLDREIVGRHFNLAGRPLGPPVRVDGDGPGFARRPAAARSGSGNILVVWERELDGGASAGIWGRLLDSTGRRLSAPFRIDQGQGVEDSGRPAVAALGNGLALVVWEGCCDASGDLGIFGRVLQADATPFTPVFPINTTTEGNQRVPAVSSDLSGRFVVAWQGPNGEVEDDRDVFRVFARTVLRSGPAGQEVVASDGPGWGHSSPAVAAGARGEVFVAWMTWMGDFRIGLYGSRLVTESGGQVSAGPEFQVSENPIGGQFRIGAAATPTGRFLVAWEGFDNRDDLGVNARLLLPGGEDPGATCDGVSFGPMTASGDCGP